MSFFNDIKERAKARYSEYRTEKLADEAAERMAASKYKAERRRLLVANAGKAAAKDLKREAPAYGQSGLSRLAGGVKKTLASAREYNQQNQKKRATADSGAFSWDAHYDMLSGKKTRR